MQEGTVELAHGGGGAASWQLVREVFASRFGACGLQPEGDAALVELPSGATLAITTDAFVAYPPLFPGGNIGTLAVTGTCNDLAVMGARPRWLTCAFIISVGTSIKLLADLAEAMATEARTQQVQIVAGDTKVVENHGREPQIYITSTGVGIIEAELAWRCDRVRSDDVLILTGTIGEHTMALLGARHGWSMGRIESDCVSLYPLLRRLHQQRGVHFARDVTRGGLLGVCHELVQATGLSAMLDEACIPITDEVAGRCELLGYDPLTLANEGKALLVVAADTAALVMSRLRSHPLGRKASVIGRMSDKTVPPLVILNTSVGGQRVLPPPTGTLFPRIC